MWKEKEDIARATSGFEKSTSGFGVQQVEKGNATSGKR